MTKSLKSEEYKILHKPIYFERILIHIYNMRKLYMLCIVALEWCVSRFILLLTQNWSWAAAALNWPPMIILRRLFSSTLTLCTSSSTCCRFLADPIKNHVYDRVYFFVIWDIDKRFSIQKKRVRATFFDWAVGQSWKLSVSRTLLDGLRWKPKNKYDFTFFTFFERA